MPIVGNEAAEYGYENENRAFTRWFLDGVQPELNFHAGRDVTELLMACYMSAEEERVIEWKPSNLQSARAAAGQALTPPRSSARSPRAGCRWHSCPVIRASRSASRATASAIARSTDAIAGDAEAAACAAASCGRTTSSRCRSARRSAALARDGRRLDHFHRSSRATCAKASIALSAYNISITGRFFRRGNRARVRHDHCARRAAHHLVVQHRDGGAHRAGRRAAKDGRRRCTITRGSIPTSLRRRRA